MMLEGIKVIDFTQYLPGPFATLRLGDLGAEVIKIERPEGDPARQLSGGKVFQANNRNKQSVALNIKDPSDRETAKRMIQQADVVIESFRPGVLESLGLGYEEIQKLHPGIVYCSLTGYGQTGALSKLGSHDINYMALSGLLSQMKDENNRPVHPSLTFADLIGGMAASEAILAALVKKAKTGTGSYIDLAITDAAISLLTTHLQYPEGRGVKGLEGGTISYRLYETKDGRFMSLGALEPKFWQNFCQAAGHEEWGRWHLERAIPGNEAFEAVTQLFLSRTFAEWMEFSERVDCCLAPVLETYEVESSTYNQSRGLITQSPWNDMQVQTTARPRAMNPPPKLNEHHDLHTPLPNQP
ncbi:crotonobetainyl-CoA:carnitine CoA-transferase CaiB-like acyl-CoA transferase [Bacillus ectoiniformans]|uniref:CaiB/BaiF CoA transferase family protein n=1 Tax=Bacillus ectoiniformans TaxID=1494429 RepID=UPI001EF99188|nr:CoA transferase [Bacillus ectoiniformans]MBM7647711.1 crotonobetainyl-CoA:carnitine CoA-transferase CaiB-like acyl-CoA transferase [Bacillus ectoiniformans]